MHIYTCSDGKEVPSVTTILQILGSKEIIKWANYLGFKHIDYEKELDRTANNGTKVHEVLQKFVDPALKDHEIAYKDDLEKAFCQYSLDNFVSMISKYKFETIFTEKTFSSSSLGYGGTMDWLAKFGDYTLLCDFKTSKQVRLKHLLQLGGYYNLLKEHGYEIHGGAIIIANPQKSMMYPINLDTIIEMGLKFNLISELYTFVESQHPMDMGLLEKIKGAV